MENRGSTHILQRYRRKKKTMAIFSFKNVGFTTLCVEAEKWSMTISTLQSVLISITTSSHLILDRRQIKHNFEKKKIYDRLQSLQLTQIRL